MGQNTKLGRLLLRYLITALILISGAKTSAQVLRIEDKPSIDQYLHGFRDLRCMEKDCRKLLDSLTNRLRQAGFLLAEVTKRSRGDTLFLEVKEGPKYSYTNLDMSQVPPEIRYELANGDQGLLTPGRLDSLYEQVIIHYENRGYPFVSVQLDSLHFTGTRISGRVAVNKGPEVIFSRVTDLAGNYSSSWLAKRMSVKPGELYTQEKIDNLLTALSNSGVEVVSYTVEFVDNRKAIIQLTTEKNPSSRFDGLLGLQENRLTGKSTLAGYLQLSLDNLFKSAKQLDLNWERLRPLTQELEIDYRHPAIFRRTDLAAHFDLIRMDSSFLNRNVGIEFTTRLNENWGLLSRYHLVSSALLDRSPDSELPDASQSILHSGGLGVVRWSGRNRIRARVLAGAKSVARSSSESNPTGGERVLQWSADLFTDHYLGINSLWELRVSGRAGMVISSQLFQNDLALLGGLQTIRGFNERSFFADQYALIQVEPRLLTGNGSYLLIFWDSGWLSLPPYSQGVWVNGWGVGLDLDLDMTRFRLLAGWGKESSQPIDFANPRIHIGFISNF